MEDPGRGGSRHIESVERPLEGCWQTSGLLNEAPRSIIVVMLSALGDAVQVLPVVSALRRTFPTTHIAWVLQPGPRSLVGQHPAVDEFMILERRRKKTRGPLFFSGLPEFVAATRSLRSSAAGQPGGRFDLLLDLQVYLKAGLITALTPARIKLGFDWQRSRDVNWLFTTHRIPSAPHRFGHIQEQYFEFLHHIGVDPRPLAYGLELSEEERRSQNEFFSARNRPTCALVAASSDRRKNWNPKGYAEVASRVSSEFGLQPMLVGGFSSAENEMVQAITAQCDQPILDARGGGLRRLLWLLEGSSLAISPDTGPLHMARAMDVPVVGLYGFTNPKRSGPYKRFSSLIVDGYARFPEEDYPVSMERRKNGMKRITPEMVLEKVDIALRDAGA